MATPGPNEPCPCGSGKKYKKCHWAAEQSAATGSQLAARLHEMDRGLVDRMVQFATKELGEDWLHPLFEDLDTEPSHVTMLLLGPSSIYEWQIDGNTILSRFLGSPTGPLSERERGWLAAQKGAWLSIWEVQSVVPGVSASVRDFFTGETRTVLERQASRTLVPRDCMLGRIVDFDGVSVFCGMYGRTLPPKRGDALVRAIRRDARLGPKAVTVSRLRASMFLEEWFTLWEDAVAEFDDMLSVPPTLQNTDGDPLLMTRDHFDFAAKDHAQLDAKLAEMDPDADSPEAPRVFSFQRPGNPMHKSWDNTIVGRAVLSKTSLVLETNSVKRADDLRAKVEAALGGLLRHRLRDHEDPTVALESVRGGGTQPRGMAEGTPPELQEALRDLKRRHMDGWVDTPIPALAGMTPREAVAKPRKRKDVILMLKESENRESRAPEGERLDLSPVWETLGIRPEER